MPLPSAQAEHGTPFPEKRRIALVIGVDNAPHSGKEPLHTAVADARDIAHALHTYCGFELFGGEPLLDAQAASHTVNDAIRDLVRNRTDDDFLLFYFSGHGLPMLLKNNREDVYLVTHDFKALDVEEDENRHISFKWLWEWLYQGNNAGKVVIILDCCYAGNMAAHGQDLNMRDILHRLRTYFDNLNFEPDAKMDGLRQTLAATAYNRTTSDTDGRMTTLLVSALAGEASGAINAQNQVTLHSLCDYFDAENRPVNLSGNNANRQCLLALHRKAPQTHFPYEPDPLFQAREQELAELETRLCAASSSPVRLGLTGIGGVGKSSLAKELTYRQQHYFTDGIFWLTLTPTQSATITTKEESNKAFISSLASLASKTRYLPLNEDIAYPNDEQRARHLCQFLAHHPKSLLILDDLDDPYLLVTLLPELAGSSLSCTILYTSRISFGPAGIKIYPIVPLFHERALFTLLLQDVRPTELQWMLDGNNNAETEAVRSICQRTGGLPLAILLLRFQLMMTPWLTLKELDQEMEVRGVLAIADNDDSIYRSLSATFDLSWRRLIDNDQAQTLFKLASYFPGAASIPFWLLALATGMEEKYATGNALGTARIALYRLGLIENIPNNKAEIQMHRLLREFGQHLVEQDTYGHSLLQEAAERVVSAFEALPALVERAQAYGYWTCLHQLRVACAYVSALNQPYVERLSKVEHRLARETFFLGASQLWPVQLPGLFYQQMYNRMLEDNLSLTPLAHIPWLRQLEPVGIEENELLKVFASHKEEVLSVAFSPDGSKIVTGSADSTACLFDVLTSKPLYVLSGHNGAIHSVAFSLDGLFVLTGSKDNTACLWNAENGALITRFVGHTDQVTVVAFAPHTAQILTGAVDGTARIWDSTGVEITLFPIISSLFTIIPRTPQLFDDESDDDYDDYDDEEPENGPNPDAIACAAFSPDGSLILLGLVGGNIVLWNTTQNTRMIIRQERIGTVNSIAFSPDGSQFLTGSADNMARLWNSASRQCLVTFTGHTAPILSVAFSPTGNSILTGSWDRTIRLWDKASGRLLHKYTALVGAINSVAFSPAGTSILVGSAETIVRLLDCTQFLSTITSSDEHVDESSALLSLPEEPVPDHADIASMSFSYDGSQLLTVYANAVIYLWNVLNGTKQHRTLQQIGRVFTATFSPDGTKIASGSLDKTAYVWDAQSGKLLAICTGHARPVRCVTFSPDSSHLLTGSDDASARIWHIEKGKATNRKTLSGHLSPVTTVAFSPDGQHILTGSEDSAARLWKHVGRNKYQCIPLPGHVHGVTAGAFSPDGTWLLTAASDTTLRLWEASSGTLLHTTASHTGPIYLVAFAPNSRLVLTGDLFDQIRIWYINDDRSLRLLGAYATSCKIRALCWQDNYRFLLADDRGATRDPHIYRLQLEGFG